MELLKLISDFIVAIYGYIKFWHQVDHWEEGVVLRKGKFHRVILPGWQWKWPFYEFVEVTNVKEDTMEVQPITITTLDGKTISIGVVLSYKIHDVKLFLVENNDSLTNMTDKTRGALSDVIEDCEWSAIRGKPTKTKVKNELKDDFAKMGVTISDLKFTHKSQVISIALASNTPQEAKTLIHKTAN